MILRSKVLWNHNFKKKKVSCSYLHWLLKNSRLKFSKVTKCHLVVLTGPALSNKVLNVSRIEHMLKIISFNRVTSMLYKNILIFEIARIYLKILILKVLVVKFNKKSRNLGFWSTLTRIWLNFKSDLNNEFFHNHASKKYEISFLK